MEEKTRIKGRDYGRQTIITMEIISNYFVDIFYNELYNVAKQRKVNGESQSVTDGYKHALQAWYQGLNQRQDLFKKIRHGLFMHYMHYVQFTTRLEECVDSLVKEFLPDGYMECLNLVKKISVLNLVIKNSNIEFISRIVHYYFPIIIDNHNVDNAMILKNEMIELLLLEREKMFQRFIAPRKAISHEMIEEKIKTVLREKYELTMQLKKLKKIACRLMNENKTLKEQLQRVNPEEVQDEAEMAVSKELESEMAEANNLAYDVLNQGGSASPPETPGVKNRKYADDSSSPSPTSSPITKKRLDEEEEAQLKSSLYDDADEEPSRSKPETSHYDFDLDDSGRGPSIAKSDRRSIESLDLDDLEANF